MGDEWVYGTAADVQAYMDRQEQEWEPRQVDVPTPGLDKLREIERTPGGGFRWKYVKRKE